MGNFELEIIDRKPFSICELNLPLSLTIVVKNYIYYKDVTPALKMAIKNLIFEIYDVCEKHRTEKTTMCRIVPIYQEMEVNILIIRVDILPPCLVASIIDTTITDALPNIMGHKFAQFVESGGRTTGWERFTN